MIVHIQGKILVRSLKAAVCVCNSHHPGTSRRTASEVGVFLDIALGTGSLWGVSILRMTVASCHSAGLARTEMSLRPTGENTLVPMLDIWDNDE